jgi:hypothetical protein
MARNLTHCPGCSHPLKGFQIICSSCLELAWNRASVAQEKATALQTHSRLTRATARRIRKDRQLHPSGGTRLPPLNNQPDLISLTLSHFISGPRSSQPETVQESERIPVDRLLSWPTSTTVFVWGHGRPDSSLGQYPLRSSEVARRVAAEQGWDEDEWAAWAAEFEVSQSLTKTLEESGPQLWEDPAVQGWRLLRTD